MEHVIIHENVVSKLCTQDEESHPGAVLDTNDTDGRKPSPWFPECLLCNSGIGVPTLVGLELRELLLHHEPAQTQPRAHEGAIDGEVEDEGQPDVSGVCHGGWGHEVRRSYRGQEAGLTW